MNEVKGKAEKTAQECFNRILLPTTGGYLTVFLSLILSIMISLCLVLILGARENLRRMQIECITDICMNNILAEYHRELLEQYDLFFIDTSYGTSYASYEQTAAHLEEYLTYNLGGEDIFLSSVYRNPTGLEVESVQITGVSAACDDGGAVLRRQVADVMSERIGITYLQQIADWSEVVKEYEMDTRDILAEQQAAVAELEAWEGSFGEETVDIEIPGENVVSFWEAGMLNLLILDTSSLSAASVQPQEYVSHRNCLQGTGMQSAVTFDDNFWDQLLFQEYVMQYTGCYGAEKENSCLKYQTEYILAGKGSDVENLQEIAYRLLAIRAVSNVLHLVTDKEKVKLIETVAGTLSTVLLMPELKIMFQTILVLTWALFESMCDVALLLAGYKVPLLKSAKDWHYSLEYMLGFDGNLDSVTQDEGLAYEDYLRILLCLQDKETTTFRLMDIMEMDIRQTDGNRYFRMDACIDGLQADIVFSSKDEKSYFISRSYGY